MAALFVMIYNLNDTINQNTFCLEALLGVTFYKLIIINSLTVAATNVVSFSLTYYIAGGSKNKNAKTQYDHEYVSQAYIDLNYNQALFLIGILYAPMLPILWVIMNAFEFVVLVGCLKCWCRLAEKPYESKDANYTLWYLGVTWAICALPMANFLAQPPSQNCGGTITGGTKCVCGPFDPGSTTMKYRSISTFISEQATWVYDLATYLLNPMVVYGVILILVTIIVWLATQLRQVRAQCIDTYVSNYHLIQDKQRLTNTSAKSVEEYKKTITELEQQLEKKKN